MKRRTTDFGHGPDRTGVVAAAPKRRQAGAQRSELLPENAAGPAFDPVDDLSHAQGRVRFDEQVNVVWHHFHRVDSHAVFFGCLDDQFLQAGVNRSDEDLAPIFRAPDEVILQAENNPGAGSVSWFGGHAACYTSAGYIATSFRIAAIPLSPEGDSFSRRHL